MLYSHMVGYAGSPTYTVYIDDLDPVQGPGQGHGAFEFPTTSEAVHAGGDDRSPLAGLFGWPISIVAKRLDGARCHFVRR